LEIVHRAAPCRNVPVTFTLDFMADAQTPIAAPNEPGVPPSVAGVNAQGEALLRWFLIGFKVLLALPLLYCCVLVGYIGIHIGQAGSPLLLLSAVYAAVTTGIVFAKRPVVVGVCLLLGIPLLLLGVVLSTMKGPV
jgi:hypothetical protein